MNRFLCVIFLMEVAALLSDARPQTLADLARREREHRRPSAGRVYTNADIPSVGAITITNPAPAAPVPATQEPAAEADKNAENATKVQGPTDNQGRGEQYWRTTFETARKDLKRSEDRLLLLEQTRAALNTQLMQSDLYNGDNVIRASIRTTEIDLAAARSESETARRRIGELEEELRRSGGLPGWAR